MRKVRYKNNKAEKGSLIVLGFFLIFLIPSLYSLRQFFKESDIALKYHLSGTRAAGEVISLAQVKKNIEGDDGIFREETFYAPVISFTVDKNKYQFESKHSSNFGMYKKGQEVEVVYIDNNPHSARISSLYILFSASGVLLIAGLGFGFASLFGITIYVKPLLIRKKIMKEGIKVKAKAQEIVRVKNRNDSRGKAFCYVLKDTTGTHQKKFYSDITYNLNESDFRPFFVDLYISKKDKNTYFSIMPAQFS